MDSGLTHRCINEIADRAERIQKALQRGSLTERDGRWLAEQSVFVYKDSPSGPVLGFGRSDAAVPEEADDSDASIPFIVTTDDEDRDGDIVKPMGCQLKNYSNNPVAFFAHQDWQVPIGVCRSPDGKITVYPSESDVRDVIYFDKPDPDAMFIFGKCQRKILNATSIAFVPISAWKRDEREKAHHDRNGMPLGWFFDAWDKTEVSVVGVPSNPWATQQQKDMRGALRDSLDRERKFITPRLQKALVPYCAESRGKCWSGWCPVPNGVAKSTGYEQGSEGVANRTVNAENRFIEYAMQTASLTRSEAEKVLERYKKDRAIKIDKIGGQFTFTHGGFGDKDVLLRAAGKIKSIHKFYYNPTPVNKKLDVFLSILDRIQPGSSKIVQDRKVDRGTRSNDARFADTDRQYRIDGGDWASRESVAAELESKNTLKSVRKFYYNSLSGKKVDGDWDTRQAASSAITAAIPGATVGADGKVSLGGAHVGWLVDPDEEFKMKGKSCGCHKNGKTSKRPASTVKGPPELPPRPRDWETDFPVNAMSLTPADKQRMSETCGPELAAWRQAAREHYDIPHADARAQHRRTYEQAFDALRNAWRRAGGKSLKRKTKSDYDDGMVVGENDCNDDIGRNRPYRDMLQRNLPGAYQNRDEDFKRGWKQGYQSYLQRMMPDGRRKDLSESNGTTGGYTVPDAWGEPCAFCGEVECDGNCGAMIGKRSRRSKASTSSDVRSPTETSTSTEALTSGNFTSTVTGGAGDGDTTVNIYMSEPCAFCGETDCDGDCDAAKPTLGTSSVGIKSVRRNAMAARKTAKTKKTAVKTRRKAVEDETPPVEMDLDDEGNTEELKDEVVEEESFTPKPSAMEAAKAYAHLKELNEYMTEALKSMDHPGMAESMKDLTENHIPAAMDHIAKAVGEHHGDLGEDSGEVMTKLCKALDMPTGEANLVDRGDLPPEIEEDDEDEEGIEEVEAVEEKTEFEDDGESKSEVGSDEWAAEEADEPEHKAQITNTACRECNGTGKVRVNRTRSNPNGNAAPCDVCHGTGFVDTKEKSDGEDEVVEMEAEPDTAEILERYQQPKSMKKALYGIVNPRGMWLTSQGKFGNEQMARVFSNESEARQLADQLGLEVRETLKRLKSLVWATRKASPARVAAVMTKGGRIRTDSQGRKWLVTAKSHNVWIVRTSDGSYQVVDEATWKPIQTGMGSDKFPDSEMARRRAEQSGLTVVGEKRLRRIIKAGQWFASAEGSNNWQVLDEDHNVVTDQKFSSQSQAEQFIRSNGKRVLPAEQWSKEATGPLSRKQQEAIQQAALRRASLSTWSKKYREVIQRAAKALDGLTAAHDLPEHHKSGVELHATALRDPTPNAVSRAIAHMKSLSTAPDIADHHKEAIGHHAGELAKVPKDLTDPGSMDGDGAEMTDRGNPEELKDEHTRVMCSCGWSGTEGQCPDGGADGTTPVCPKCGNPVSPAKSKDLTDEGNPAEIKRLLESGNRIKRMFERASGIRI